MEKCAVYGWIQEADNRWCYALYGGGWYTGDIYVIDEVPYIFDDAGYMVTESTIVYPYSNGLKIHVSLVRFLPEALK